ncbi:MAG: hypothetical protein HGA90_04165 [Alphaproteobacteria bacterium]|nr:hypothetical protein [Alphaproteobacteria bacterium]
MTDTYVRTKIKEAMTATGGDKRDAQKLLITWAVRDQALLLGLAKPHLKAITIARIEEETRTAKKSGDQGPDHFSKSDIDAIVAMNQPGEKRAHIKVPPPKTSTRQASVMHQLVAAFKKKK